MPIPAPPAQSPVYVGDWSGSLNGLSFGPGTPYQLVSLDGWRSMTSKPLGGIMTGASASTLPAPKGYDNGAWSIPYWMDTREVQMVFAISPGTSDWEAVIEAFEAATQPTGNNTASLTIQLGGVTTTVKGAVESRQIETDFAYQFGLAHAPVTFLAFDPRRFATTLTAVTGAPAVSGGLTVPFRVPFTIPSTVVSGQVSLANPGTANGPVTVTFTGPVTGPFVTHQQTGLVVAMASGFTVASGDTLVIDMEDQTVLYNGGASRSASVVTRGWMGFPPGGNTYGFGCASSGVGASMSVSATPSYI